MKRSWLIVVAVAALTAWFGLAGAAEAHELRGLRYAECYPWHGGYYHTAWGMPVALVVPPNVEFQTHWGWGVGNYRVTRIRHQFHRDWPGPGSYDRKMFQPTPRWPSDTDQFGVYCVRGPW